MTTLLMSLALLSTSTLQDKPVQAAATKVFTAVTGKDLNGKSVTVPTDLKDDPLVCVVCFASTDHATADRLSKLGADVKNDHPTLGVYEIQLRQKIGEDADVTLIDPLFQSVNDLAARAHVVIVFADKPTWEHAAGITAEQEPTVVLVEGDGTIAKSQPASAFKTSADFAAFLP